MLRKKRFGRITAGALGMSLLLAANLAEYKLHKHPDTPTQPIIRSATTIPTIGPLEKKLLIKERLAKDYKPKPKNKKHGEQLSRSKNR